MSEATAEALPEIVGEPPADDVRSPADVVRLVTAVGVFLLACGVGWLAGDTVRSAQSDLAKLTQYLPEALRDAMAGTAQLSVLLIPLGAVGVLLLNHRTRVIGRALLAGLATVPLCLLLTTLAADVTPSDLDAAASSTAWIRDSGFPGTAYLGALAAAATVIGPWTSRSWRRTIWWAVGIVAVLRVLSEASAPFVLLAAGAIGVAVGSAVLLIFGAPDRAPAPADVARALAAAEVPIRRLAFTRATREGVHAYLAETVDGEQRYVALMSDDDRRRDLIFRVYRFLRVKNVADEAVLRSTRAMAEHRAFLALWANEAGVHTPRPDALARLDDSAMAVVEEVVPGTALHHLDADDLDDDALGALWHELSALHAGRIAHRDLRGRSVRLATPEEAGDRPRAAFVDFTWAELAADDRLLGIDLAQLLTEVALLVGIERTVATARDTLGADGLAAALPYLQLPALTSETRKQARKQKGLVADLRAAVVTATGAEEVELEKLERITLSQVLTVVVIGFAVYLLAPMIASLPEVWEALQEAEWGWILATLPLVAGMYVGSTLNFMGAVPGRLPFGLTYEVQLASAFLNRVTPKNIGGMALRLRFLTLRGIDPATAAGSVGLTSVAGTVSTTILMIVFFLWAGRSEGLTFDMPSIGTILLVVVGLAALVGVFMLFPFGRKLVIDKAWGWIRTALTNLGPLLRDPVKLTMLLCGNALNTLLQIVALAWTLRAFGVPLPFPQVGVVYLFSNLVASASPTPGGIGVIEAALIAMLTRFGVPDAEATSAVLVFRLVTYWLVVLPGWVSLRRLRAREVV